MRKMNKNFPVDLELAQFEPSIGWLQLTYRRLGGGKEMKNQEKKM